MKDPKKTTKNHSKKSSVRLTSLVIPERYKIFLKPDLDNFIFEGEETIYLKLVKPTNKITLHASELEIQSVEFVIPTEGKRVEGSSQVILGERDSSTLVYPERSRRARNDKVLGKISYDQKSETATFTFPKSIPAGKGELKLKFKGILNDRMRGFYRSQYEVDGQIKHMATTQFESTDARRAFPCFDEPSQKSIFDVTLMIPSHTIAISNTLETVVNEHDSGYKTVEFAPTPKMSTYLLAFIVGEFEYLEKKSKNGTLVRVFTTPGKKKQAEFALEASSRCLAFYEEYFDIKYPLPVLDLIAIPDFSAGAMENWGAITYRESALLVDQQHSSLSNKQWVALVIAHELAHQWFGNLVTMEWWTHLWLNEGFASYIEYLAVDHLFPEWDIWTQFIYLDQGAALKLDGLINTHPIEVEVRHPAEISEIFDRVSYSKGASVIRMLANYIGEQDFRKGLSEYLNKHQYANASTEDLWEAFEAISGKPVKQVMKNWTNQPGYPVLTLEEKKDQLIAYQSRFFSSKISQQQTKDNTSWAIPLKVQKEKSKSEEQYLMQTKKLVIPNIKEGSWIKLNSGEVSFLRVDYPAKYLHLLKKAVEKKEIPAVDRLGIIRDAFALSEAGRLPTYEALDLVLSYKDEENLTVWNEISFGIDKVNNLTAGETFDEKFNDYGREVFATIAKKMGWEKRKGEKHTDVMLRSLALYHFGIFGDVETISMAQKLFQGQLEGKNIDPDLKGVVYTLVAKNGGAKEYQDMIALYKKENNSQEQERLAKALGSFKEPKLLQKSLDFAFSKDVRLQDAVYFVMYVWMNPKGRDLTWEFIQKRWELLKEKFAGGYLLSRMLQTAGEFTEVKKANEIKRFFAKNPSNDVKRTIQQVLEQIYSNADWLKRDKKGIKKFLEEFS